MKSILFITAFPPNYKTAGQAYTLRLLQKLSIDFDIDLIYWEYPGHHPEINNIHYLFQGNTSNRDTLINTIKTRYFPLFSKRYNPRIANYIRENSSKYDYIYFDYSQTFIYANKLDHHCKIAMVHDVISQKFNREIKYLTLLPWISNNERKLLNNFNHIFTFSVKDCELLKNLYDTDSTPIPFYLDPKIEQIDLMHTNIDNYFVMFGAWNRNENIESLEWVLKHNTPDCPHIKIIGGGLEQEIITKITKQRNMEYLGFVTNPYPVIAKSKGLIAPLFHGAGVKVKVIESLALGTPIIGTDITFEGIPQLAGPIESLYNLNDISLEESFNIIKGINNSDKCLIQRLFYNKYNKQHFDELLKSGAL